MFSSVRKHFVICCEIGVQSFCGNGFLQEDLYATICGLSYMGDVRMLFAEDKHKVKI